MLALTSFGSLRLVLINMDGSISLYWIMRPDQLAVLVTLFTFAIVKLVRLAWPGDYFRACRVVIAGAFSVSAQAKRVWHVMFGNGVWQRHYGGDCGYSPRNFAGEVTSSPLET